MSTRAYRNQLRRAKAKKTREQLEERSVRSRACIFDYTRPVVIYARQSNLVQMERNPQSFEDQTEGQRKRAMELGWREDQIEIVTVDMDYSGTVDIDDREGLSAILAKIKTCQYAAVFSWIEDRLFRDEYLDNATRFARACATTSTYLITERYIYDLRDEMERERFFMEVRFGWAYYKNHVLGTLMQRKRSAAKAGKYDGRNVTAGYTVRHEKNDPNDKRMVPLPEHAAVVQRWCDRLLELGDLSRFYYELRNQPGPHFPPTNDPHFKTALTPYPGGGWRVKTRQGVRQILKSRVLIGDLRVYGEWIVGHHEPILDAEKFARIQPLLRKAEGAPPVKRYQPTELLLHKSPAFHGPEGTYITRGGRLDDYQVMYNDVELKAAREVSLPTSVVEQVFVHVLLANIRKTKQLDDFAQKANEVVQKQRAYVAGVQESIVEIEAKLRVQEIKIETATGLQVMAKQQNKPELEQQAASMIVEAVTEQASLALRKAELEKKLDVAPQDAAKLMKLVLVLDTLEEHFNEFSTDTLQDLVNLVARDILLCNLSMHFVLLRVQWSYVWEVQDIIIYRRQPGKRNHTEAEREWIRDNYPKLTANELVEAFPSRAWAGLTSTALKLGLPFRGNVGLKYPENYSLEDLRVMEQYNITLGAIEAQTNMVVDRNGKSDRRQFQYFTCVGNNTSYSPSLLAYSSWIDELEALITRA